MNTTWRKLIMDEMSMNYDSWDNIVSNTLSDKEVDREFDDGYGCSRGTAFTVWTHDRVYFPVVYDGAEWCSSVARNPNGVATRHVGGE
jgi:hypothetical protein